MNIAIGQMRSTVVFKTNSPVTTATSGRETVNTGQSDVYSTLITTRGRLRKKNGSRGLELGLLSGQESYELICRFQTTIDSSLKVNLKVFVDSVEYTVESWEVLDDIKHWYKFQLNTQRGS